MRGDAANVLSCSHAYKLLSNVHQEVLRAGRGFCLTALVRVLVLQDSSRKLLRMAVCDEWRYCIWLVVIATSRLGGQGAAADVGAV